MSSQPINDGSSVAGLELGFSIETKIIFIIVIVIIIITPILILLLNTKTSNKKCSSNEKNCGGVCYNSDDKTCIKGIIYDSSQVCDDNPNKPVICDNILKQCDKVKKVCVECKKGRVLCNGEDTVCCPENNFCKGGKCITCDPNTLKENEICTSNGPCESKKVYEKDKVKYCCNTDLCGTVCCSENYFCNSDGKCTACESKRVYEKDKVKYCCNTDLCGTVCCPENYFCKDGTCITCKTPIGDGVNNNNVCDYSSLCQTKFPRCKTCTNINDYMIMSCSETENDEILSKDCIPYDPSSNPKQTEYGCPVKKDPFLWSTYIGTACHHDTVDYNCCINGANISQDYSPGFNKMDFCVLDDFTKINNPKLSVSNKDGLNTAVSSPFLQNVDDNVVIYDVPNDSISNYDQSKIIGVCKTNNSDFRKNENKVTSLKFGQPGNPNNWQNPPPECQKS